MMNRARSIFWLLVGAVVTALVWTTWMKWFDLFVDAGREVYIPWRILQGEQIGQDIVHAYGPLSVYVNAALFAVFGVGIRTLVVANLLIYAGIVILSFVVLRRAFGFLPAAVATFFGVLVFGFSHHLFVANYTFAMPYSHEATHGLLLLLVLLTLLLSPRRKVTWFRGLLVGIITGLLWLTKTEYVLTSAVVLAIDGARISFEAGQRPNRWRWFGGVAAGTVATLFATWVALATVTGPHVAFITATSGLLAPIYYRAYSLGADVKMFLGADRPVENLTQIVCWGGLGVAVLVVTFYGGRLASRLSRASGFVLLAVIGVSLALTCYRYVGWEFFGWTIPGLGVAAMVMRFRDRRALPAREWIARSPRDWAQLLVLVAGLAMLARMALAPKIFHYGFYQAFLATLWLVAFFVGEWPRLAGRTRFERRGLAFVGMAAFAGVAAASLQHSLSIYNLRATPVGEGADRVYAYRQEAYPFSDTWDKLRQRIVAATPADATVLVVPEGLSLNYWTRRRHPLAIMDLMPTTLKLSPRDVLTQLKEAPPDVVVFLMRAQVSDSGFSVYGSDPATGSEIVAWVRENYTLVAKAGEDPFVAGKFGINLFFRQPNE